MDWVTARMRFVISRATRCGFMNLTSCLTLKLPSSSRCSLSFSTSSSFSGPRLFFDFFLAAIFFRRSRTGFITWSTLSFFVLPAFFFGGMAGAVGARRPGRRAAGAAGAPPSGASEPRRS